MIPRLCQRAQQRVSLDDPRRNRGVNAAHQKHRLYAGLNVLISVANRVCRRSAARRNHVAVSAESETHADFARDRPHRSAGNAENADLFHVPAMPQPVLLFGKFLRAAARPENHANLAFFLHRH